MKAPGRALHHRTAIAALLVALATAFYLWWEVSRRGIFAYSSVYPISDADEWRYTACSRLVAHGYALFSQVFSAQPPLLFLSLAGGMRLFGETILGARAVEIAFGLVAMLAASGCAWLLAGRAAAAITAILLVLTPTFLVYSHTVEAEGPMLAMTTLALVLILLHARRPHAFLVVLGGLALAAAILFKLFAFEAILPAAWIILLSGASVRLALRNLVMFVVSVAVPLVADFGLVSPRQQWQQVVSLHSAAASATIPNVTPVGTIVWQYLSLDLGLSVLAAAGLVMLAIRRRWLEFGFLVLWLPGSLLMLVVFHPLFQHHLAILAAPIAISAGIAVAMLGECLLAREWKYAVLPAIAVLIYLVLVPRLAHDDRHVLVAVPSMQNDPLVLWVQHHAGPDQFVAADDLKVVDVAGRLVPPPLCDPSNVRLRAGYLTGAEAIRATRRYHTRLVVSSFGIYAQIPGYLPWAASHYRAVPAPEGAKAFVSR
ncbi:MAG: ArnT family glycosyltransferase [Chloroflexota bacterium]